MTLPPEGLYLNEVLYEEPSDNAGGLLANLDKLRVTELGEQRIRKNLDLNVPSVVEWAKSQIRSPKVEITRVGKNYQVFCENCRITVNAGSFTIITAHKK